MANPAPVRPWSRLGSLRPVSQNQSPQPPSQSNGSSLVTPPRFVIAPPKTSAPSSPPKKFPVPSSQEQKDLTINNNANATVTKSPPSPITSLSSDQVNIDDAHKNSKEKSIYKKLQNLGKSDDAFRAITISGENRGAYMEIVQSSKKPSHPQNDKGKNSKTKTHDHHHESKDKNLKGRRTLYINSNVQCVNNSLLYDTSCTSNDPGLHVFLSTQPFGQEKASIPAKKHLN